MKKIITLAFSIIFLVVAVACSNDREPANNDMNNKTSTNTATDKAGTDEYYNTYTGLYNQDIKPLSAYNMYTDVNTVNDAYKDKDYPGNEKYLSDVKEAYRDSREKIQSFVNGLKNDASTNDAELKKMNQELIDEGEKLIKNIDARLAKLDTITDKDLTKNRDDFIKLVDDRVNSVQTDNNKFTDMLKNMNNRLGIDNNNNQNSGMDNNHNRSK